MAARARVLETRHIHGLGRECHDCIAVMQRWARLGGAVVDVERARGLQRKGPSVRKCYYVSNPAVLSVDVY